MGFFTFFTDLFCFLIVSIKLLFFSCISSVPTLTNFIFGFIFFGSQIFSFFTYRIFQFLNFTHTFTFKDYRFFPSFFRLVNSYCLLYLLYFYSLHQFFLPISWSLFSFFGLIMKIFSFFFAFTV